VILNVETWTFLIAAAAVVLSRHHDAPVGVDGDHGGKAYLGIRETMSRALGSELPADLLERLSGRNLEPLADKVI
jgi:hypothetical protein